MIDGIPVQASGNIYPARFVTVSGRYTVAESDSGATKILGVTAEHTRNTPDSNGSSYHAISGDHVTLRRIGDVCKLTIGSGGCTAGDFLKPDNDGKGVTATTGNVAGAIALETASENELCDVQVLPPTYVA